MSTTHGSRDPVRHIHLGDHTTEVVDINGDGAAGPAVVLIHALGLTWRMWEPVMRALAHGRRVLAYDIRGHGSAADAPPPAHMEILADDLHQLLAAEGLTSAHIVGLSYGGAIAQAFATKHPDAVESLTLAATTHRPFDSFEARAAAVERDGTAAQVASSLTRWFTPAALAENTPGVRYARECVRRGDPTQVAAAWRAFLQLDTADRLSQLRTPTLVLAGERDASTTPQAMRPIADTIPGATYVEMAGAPHMPTLETPHLVVEALDHFLPRSSS
jgi:3-oxoadipate enol-lactonase